MKGHLSKVLCLVVLASATVLLASNALAGTFRTLYSFHGDDGSAPTAPLTADTLGNLYGTTAYGGTHSTVFELVRPARPERAWTEAVLHAFHFGGAANP